MNRWSLTLIALLAAPLVIFAADPDPRVIEDLIKKLGDNRYETRVEAARSIERIGPAALPVLKRHRSHPDIHVRKQVALWIPLLERIHLITPTIVTLDKKRTVADAIADIARQSGYSINLAPGSKANETRISHDLRKVPCWEALEAVCAEAGLHIRVLPGKRELLLEPGKPAASCNRGAFRVVARVRGSAPAPANANKNIASRMAFLELAVMAEPKLRIADVGNVRITQLIDDNGKDIERCDPKEEMRQPKRWQRGNKPSTAPQLIPLMAPSDVNKIKRLKGRLAIRVVSGIEEHPLCDKLENAVGSCTTVDDLELRIDEFRKEREACRVTLQVAGRRRKFDHAHVVLKDSDGNAVAAELRSTTVKDAATVVSLSFAMPKGFKEPVQLVYRVDEHSEHELEFEFEGLDVVR